MTGFELAYPDSVVYVGVLSIKLHDMLWSTNGLEFQIKKNLEDDAIAQSPICMAWVMIKIKLEVPLDKTHCAICCLKWKTKTMQGWIWLWTWRFYIVKKVTSLCRGMDITIILTKIQDRNCQRLKQIYVAQKRNWWNWFMICAAFSGNSQKVAWFHTIIFAVVWKIHAVPLMVK